MSEGGSKEDQQQKPLGPFSGIFGKSQDSNSSNQKPTTSLFSNPSLFQAGFSQPQQPSLFQSSQQKNQLLLPSIPQKQNLSVGFANQSQQSKKEKEEEKENFELSWIPRKPTSNDKEIATFKVVVIGEGGVGKSSWVQRYLSPGFQKKYIATMGVEVASLNLMTNYGLVKFNIWDCAGQEKLGGLREGYYLGADCAIIMFDVTSRITYKNILKWYKDVYRICKNVPVVLVGNKVESNCRKVETKDITFHKGKFMQYCELSGRSGYQYEKPFLLLLRMLALNNTIELLSEPIPQPEEARLTEDEIKQVIEYEEIGEDAPLPEDNVDKEFGSNEFIVED